MNDANRVFELFCRKISIGPAHVLKLAIAIVAICLPLTGNALASGLPIVFVPPTDRSPSNVFIQFAGDPTLNIQYRDSNGNLQAAAQFTAYSLAQLTSSIPIAPGVGANKPAILVNKFHAARIYVNYGTQGLKNNSTNTQPTAQSPSDPDYSTRWQYVEMNYDGASFSGNLSYIDCLSIPLSMQAFNAPHAANNPQLTTVLGGTFIGAAEKSSVPAYSSVLPNHVAQDSSFARVLGSQLASVNGNTYYHNWNYYLETVLPGATATLDDCYVGSSSQPSSSPLTQQQTYNYTVTFGATAVILTPKTGSGNGSGPNICVGNGNSGAGVGDDPTQTITIQYSDLENATTGVYSNNTPYTYIYKGNPTRTTGIVNDFFGRVAGDVMAGLSLGVFGSNTPFNGTTVGALPSMYWWGGKNATTVVNVADSVGGAHLLFGGLQSNSSCYDNYAASIYRLTAGYGTPFEDRMSLNLLGLNTNTDPNAYINITFIPDHRSIVPITTLLSSGTQPPASAVTTWRKRSNVCSH